jgi:Xaa-Pro aminopeptidase
MKLIREAMHERGIDLWITFTREGNPDPVAIDLGLGGVVWRSAGIFEVDGQNIAIVGNLDAEGVRQKGIYDTVIDYGKEGASKSLYEYVRRREPKTIAVNSSYDFGLADGLSTGMRRYLRTSLKEFGKNFVTAEDLVITLRSRLIPEEIDLMRKSVQMCEEIFRVAEEDIIRIGRTDRQIYRMIQGQVKKMGLGFAWEEDHCPVVVVGNNEFGHRGFVNRTLRKDELLHFDFGVKFQGYCSDIQRVYFVGGRPPGSVRRLFEATKKATDAGVETLRAGIKGYLVDEACRKSVILSGYPEYLHGTGHAVGRATHEIGPMLSPRWRERYGRTMEKELATGMVFTIEPSVKGEDGVCNIERELLLTEKGAEPFSTPEDELYELGG